MYLTDDTLVVQHVIILEFSDEMNGVVNFIESTGETIWISFISTLQTRCPLTWFIDLVNQCCQLLRLRPKYLNSCREISQAKAFTKLLFLETKGNGPEQALREN